MALSLTARVVGIPVRSVYWVWLMAGEDRSGAPCLYTTMGQGDSCGPLFVCQIDLQTGACRSFRAQLPNANYPTTAIWSRRRRGLFIGAAYAGQLYRFDPRSETLEALGAINPQQATFPCQIDEAPDGTLYIGSYPACDLTRYAPGTGEFIRYGRMDETDQYFYPVCGADGTVAGRVGFTRPHVVAFDPQTGEHRAIGPVADANAREGFVELLKCADGLLYIRSHAGIFRVQGLEARAVEVLPPPRPDFDDSQTSTQPLPDGSTYRFLDRHTAEFRQIEIIPPLSVWPLGANRRRMIYLDWESDGSGLFVVRAGPDGKVYGSSYLPEHFFSFDPLTGALLNHGACTINQGEAYSIGQLDGRLYIASYPNGYLSVHDPAKPYRFGADRAANPRHLGRMDDTACRPLTMVTGPAGKVWVGSIPDYGMWGGTLAWYDPKTGTFGSHRHLLPDCAPHTLAWLPELDRILVGLTIDGGSGTQPRAARAGLVLWDPAADCKTWEGDFGLRIRTVYDLYALGNGLVYAMIHHFNPASRMELMLLDLRARAICARGSFDTDLLGTPMQLSSFFRHGDWLYGATYKGLYRARFGTTAVEPAWDAAAAGAPAPTAPGGLVGATWYFGAAARLMALSLPGASN
ncbi:MAG: hypothetical protein HYV35_09845 [Lentisphaerae bacterium]|nr:hypothetical protein [Lentisphaerota bacterium]